MSEWSVTLMITLLVGASVAFLVAYFILKAEFAKTLDK